MTGKSGTEVGFPRNYGRLSLMVSVIGLTTDQKVVDSSSSGRMKQLLTLCRLRDAGFFCTVASSMPGALERSSGAWAISCAATTTT
jgi:hypothetical protein